MKPLCMVCTAELDGRALYFKEEMRKINMENPEKYNICTSCLSKKLDTYYVTMTQRALYFGGYL